MSSISLNNIDMDIFLKYFTQDVIEGQSLNIVNIDSKGKLYFYDYGDYHYVSAVNIPVSKMISNMKLYFNYTGNKTVKESDITVKTDYDYPYVSVSSAIGDSVTSITSSRYTYYDISTKTIYPYVECEDSNANITTIDINPTETDNEIIVTKFEVLTDKTSKFYVEDTTTYKIYTSAGLTGYLLKNIKLYKNLCSEEGTLYTNSDGEYVFSDSGKAQSRFKRYIDVIRLNDTNSKEYQDYVLYTHASPYKIVRITNMPSSRKIHRNTDNSYINKYRYYTKQQVSYTYSLVKKSDLEDGTNISLVTKLPAELVYSSSTNSYDNKFNDEKSWTITDPIEYEAYTIADSMADFKKLIGETININVAAYNKTYYIDYLFKPEDMDDYVIKVFEENNIFSGKDITIGSSPDKTIYNSQYSYRGDLLPEYSDDPAVLLKDDLSALITNTDDELNIGSLFADGSVNKMRTHVNGIYNLLANEYTSSLKDSDNDYETFSSLQTYIYEDTNAESSVKSKTIDDITLTDEEISAVRDYVNNKNPYTNIINYEEFPITEEEINANLNILKRQKLLDDASTTETVTDMTTPSDNTVTKQSISKMDFKDNLKNFLVEFIYNWSDSKVEDSDDAYISSYKKFYYSKIENAADDVYAYSDDTKNSEIIFVNKSNVKDAIDLLASKIINRTDGEHWRIY